MSDNQKKSEIKPRPDGPLLVTNLTTLTTESGESIETKETVALCRCGHSSNKPFCDGSHKRADFSSARQTDKPIDRYRPYEGKETTVEDNRTICAHAAFCIKDLPEVFKQKESPWVQPEGASAEEITTLTHKCPSGALTAVVNGERREESTGVGEEVVIVEDGPYNVRGGVSLEVDGNLQPPVAERYALCRCGASKNKPYCDGSHGNLEKGWGRLAES